MRSIITALGVVSLVGCGMLPGLPGAQAPRAAQPATDTSHNDEAQSALAKVQQQNLDQCVKQTTATETALGVALDKAAGGEPDAVGKPTPALSAAVAKLAKMKITLTVQNVATPQNPILMVKDSLQAQGPAVAAGSTADKMAFAKKMMAAQPLLNVVRDDVAAVNTAFGKGLPAASQCTAYSKGFTTQLGAMHNGGVEPSDDLFDIYAKYLQASARSEAVLASAVALVSAAEAGVAGKDPKAIDQLVKALKDASTQHQDVTTDQARQAYKVAAQDLVDACQKQYDAALAKSGQAASGPSPCSPEGSQVKAGPGSDDPSALDGDAASDLIHKLVPNDARINAAIDGVSALAKGDFMGALKSASKLVPKGSPVGMALGLVNSLFG
jgi:hypothetical protein